MRIIQLSASALFVLAAALAAPALDAQIFQRPARSGAPVLWVSGGYGWSRPGAYDDGPTGARWQYGDAFVPSVSVELPLGRSGTTFGVTASQGDYTMRYLGGGTTGPCASIACDARGRIRSYGLLLRAGGGAGLHQILELSGGVTEYGRLRRDEDEAALEPERRRNGTLTIGYGLGFPLTQRLQLGLVQDFGLVFRSREGLPSDASRTVQNANTRITIRFGLGSR